MIKETHSHNVYREDHDIHVKIYRTYDSIMEGCREHKFQALKCRIYIDGGSKEEHEVRFCAWCGFVEGQDV